MFRSSNTGPLLWTAALLLQQVQSIPVAPAPLDLLPSVIQKNLPGPRPQAADNLSDAGTFIAVSSSASTSGPPTARAALSTWTQPTQYTDLSQAFNITNFAWGEEFASILTNSSVPDPGSSELPNNTPDSVLAVRFPKGSIDPKSNIQGGLGFYASPLDISTATNVSLSYQIFFPKNFAWAKGGKLPGLYGGREQCSGGDPADDCFSTRLMWREKGAGELYLYAPVGEQLASVCNMPPYSSCNPEYGASIGRGSFRFAQGQWTDVRQDVWLNEPGKPDGGFNLFANGNLVLHSSSIMYRKDQQSNKPTNNALNAAKLGASSNDALDDHFDQMLDGFSGAFQTASAAARTRTIRANSQILKTDTSFVGIMAELFFGGHTASFASPSDQSVYLKGFELRVNS